MANQEDDYSYDPVAAAQRAGQSTTQSSNPAYDANVYNQGLTDLYQKYYWRDPTAQEQEVHKNNPNGLAGVESMLAATPNQSQVQKPTAAAAPTAPAATGSPVTANGQIPPAGGVLQPAPRPATHGAEPNETRYLQPIDLSAAPGYQAAQFNVAKPAAYTPGALPPEVAFDQFTAPDQSGVNAKQSALIESILNNPQTMSPAVVAAMQEKNKEQALLMGSQEQQQADSSAAASGRFGSGQGFADAAMRRNAAIDSILRGNRDIEIGAASTNRADELSALQASEALSSGQLGRATSAYTTRLGGQQAQASSALQRAVAGEQFKQAASESALRSAGFDLGAQQAQAGENFTANQAAENRLLKQFGINAQVAGNAQQNYTADLSANLGQNSQLLEYLRYLESQRQFDDSLGYNYNSLDQQGQLSLLDYLNR